ncbi:MAG: phospholipase D-like domain-containing protein [Novosphingobium sp.]|jgi:phosphatidylserine/phosphatidylglycerophosphate/cardiolipin synthase-like enzyme|nr:phospholipase D-like domain-containing protein [Novosphingobium sp.]
MDRAVDEDESATPSVWRYARASRAHVVIDAAAYFELIQEAMLKARQRIFLISWDFDSRIRLGPGRRWWNLPRRAVFPARLGAFMVWLAKRTPALRIKLLAWNFGAIRFLLRGTMIIDIIRFRFNRAIGFKLDSAHPLGCSHHQKIVVIDDRFAVCGGIDVTSDRWDTRAHLQDDLRRRRPNGRLYGPWHDVTMMLEGDAASALGDLGRARWRQAGGAAMPPCAPQAESPWPEMLAAEFRSVEVGIARTRAAYNGYREISEIEALFIEQIARAKRFIYAESQYFASRCIAEAIARRVSEPDPPEILLINPVTAHGWLEQAAMDTARVRLLHAVAEKDHAGRFRVFVPVTAGGAQIYVHAKLMIVDDEILRVGSANMNNRSMGLDTECDVFIDAARPGNGHVVPTITALRHSLLAEHCGVTVDHLVSLLARHGSMAAAIDVLPRRGKRLEPFVLRPLTEAEKTIADSALLDPERPKEIFEPIGGKRGLFRRGGILRRPR